MTYEEITASLRALREEDFGPTGKGKVLRPCAGRGPGRGPAGTADPTQETHHPFPWTQEWGRCPTGLLVGRAGSRTTRSTLTWEIPVKLSTARRPILPGW